MAGKFQEYKFKIKAGELYLQCLENEIAINSFVIDSVQELSYSESPNTTSMIVRGYLGNSILGTLGLIAGMMTAKRQGIHRLQILFKDGRVGIAEVDDVIFNKIYTIS